MAAPVLKHQYLHATLDDVLLRPYDVILQLSLATGEMVLLEMREIRNYGTCEQFLVRSTRDLPRSIENISITSIKYKFHETIIRVLVDLDSQRKQRFHCSEVIEDGTRTLDHDDFVSSKSLDPIVDDDENEFASDEGELPDSEEDDPRFASELHATADYVCPRCGGSLQLSPDHDVKIRTIGRDFAICPTCDARIAVAAVLHRCSACGAALESPTSTIGESTNCDSCQNAVIVPDSILLYASDPAVDSTFFRIRCEQCDGEQAARQADVGKHSPCLFCFADIEIPIAGESVAEESAAIDTTVIFRCPVCGMRVPKKSQPCPQCGEVHK